jgi:hypothetical protein
VNADGRVVNMDWDERPPNRAAKTLYVFTSPPRGESRWAPSRCCRIADGDQHGVTLERDVPVHGRSSP